MGEWMKKLIENMKKDKKRSLLMLVLMGILMLVIVWPVTEKNDGNPLFNDEAGKNLNAGDPWMDESQRASGGIWAQNGDSLSEGQTLEAYVAAAETRLETLLSKVEGAGSVQVMITARATREKVVGKDVSETTSAVTENDSSGGSRVTDGHSYGEASLYGNTASGENGQTPYIIKELVPEIEGVVVAASGGGDEYVVDEITQAVSVLFNLPVHKIKVVKMES